MALSSWARTVFTAALVMFGVGLQVRAFKLSSVSTVSRLFLRTSTRTPATCYCGKSSIARKGTCYYMSQGKCKSRTCESSYECKSGVKTNTLCIRRKLTSKLVMVHPGVCEKKPISGYHYVPYTGPNSGTMPISRAPPKPVVKPTKNKPGLYFVVAGKKVVFKSIYLNKAKKYLEKYNRGSRCIFQVVGGVVQANPHTISGYPQTRRFGFNRYWKSKKDIRRMYTICKKYYKRTTKPRVFKTKNVRGLYFVVAGKKVVFKSIYLNKAKKYLAKYRRGSRAICQAKRGRVISNLRKIAGYSQSRKYGFNRKWKNSKDIRRMYSICNKYYIQYYRKSKKPKTKTTTKYIVVYGHKAIGRYTSLKAAKNRLKRIGSKSKTRRCIFRQVNGRVIYTPYKGGNKYFRKKTDAKYMYRIAKKYILKKAKKSKSKKYKSKSKKKYVRIY